MSKCYHYYKVYNEEKLIHGDTLQWTCTKCSKTGASRKTNKFIYTTEGLNQLLGKTQSNTEGE